MTGKIKPLIELIMLAREQLLDGTMTSKDYRGFICTMFRIDPNFKNALMIVQRQEGDTQ